LKFIQCNITPIIFEVKE